MNIVVATLKLAVALSLSAIGTLIVMASLGVSTQLMSWSLLAAAFSDNVIIKYQILLVWTLGAMLLAFVAKIVVLIRSRKEHSLRWTEYWGHGLSSGVVSGGLAYGAVIVVIAAMRGLAIDIKAIGEIDKETLANVTLLAIFPTFIAMMAAVMTAYKHIVEIPKSASPDQTIARMLLLFKGLANHANRVLLSVKKHRWFSPGGPTAAVAVVAETPLSASQKRIDTPQAIHDKGNLPRDHV